MDSARVVSQVVQLSISSRVTRQSTYAHAARFRFSENKNARRTDIRRAIFMERNNDTTKK
jgi:hypothetical protein